MDAKFWREMGVPHGLEVVWDVRGGRNLVGREKGGAWETDEEETRRLNDKLKPLRHAPDHPRPMDGDR